MAPTTDATVLDDFAAYAASFWRLPDKVGKVVDFILNVPQRIVMYEIEKQVKAGLPVRQAILKARQMGISTLVIAILLHLVVTRPGFQAFSMADKLGLPSIWLRRLQKWYKQLPAVLQPRLAASNSIEMYFDEVDSRLSISSEGGKTPGMGFALQAIHSSECGYFNNPKKVMGDLLPALSKKAWSYLFLESCGEMEGSWWEKLWNRAAAGTSKYGLNAIFLPWWLVAEYRMDPVAIGIPAFSEADYTEDEREQVAEAAHWALEHPDHAEIARFKGLCPEQLAWRRYVLSEEHGGDVDDFASRYPHTPAAAFMGVGSAAIPLQIRRAHRASSIEPVLRVQLEWVSGPETDKPKVRAVPFEHDGPVGMWPAHWAIYEPKIKVCEYALGADVAEGRASDQQDERSDPDYSSIAVLNRRNLHTAAVYHGRPAADTLGKELLKAGWYWNEGWLSPEANSAGMATLAEVKDYPHLMTRTGEVDETEVERELFRYGWKTTPANRDGMIDGWIKACRPELDGGFEGKVVCLISALADEEATFVRTKTGRREHRPGCFDDVLFAFMVALQVHQRCLHERMGAMPEREDHKAEYEALGAVVHPDMAFAGGLDDLMGLEDTNLGGDE